MDLMGLMKAQPQPRDIARDRLKLLLIHDRSNCSPHVLEMLKTDIIKAISNYMEIDETDMEIQISHADTEESSVPVLFANIPIKGVRKMPGRS